MKYAVFFFLTRAPPPISTLSPYTPLSRSTAPAAKGQVTSTTNSSVNAQGQLMSKDVSTPAGTHDHTQYQYFTNGGYQQVTESVVNADGSRSDSMTAYNWEGTYHQIVKDAIAPDASHVATTFTY